MAVDKKEKCIAILDSCQYTVQGITLLCGKIPGWHIAGVAKSYYDLLRLVERKPIDMVICGIGNHSDDFSRLLNLSRYPTRGRILLMDKSSAVLSKTFLAAGFDAVVSKQVALNELITIIARILFSEKDAVAEYGDEHCYLPQEREVLSALLKGERPCDIARTMGISYRTVSRYKLSGLRRAGLNSLNEILASKKHYAIGNAL